jgi:hypothetical protein
MKKTRQRPARPTVTVDLGNPGIQCIELCLKECLAMTEQGREKLSLPRWRTVTRSMMVRAGLILLARELNVKLPPGFTAR